MLKTFGRVLIVLTAAGLIALGWYAFSTTAADQSMLPARPAGFIQTGEPTDGQVPAGDTNEDRPVRPDDDEMSFALPRVLAGMAGKMVITAVVIVLVVLLRRLINRFTSSHFQFTEN
jgi:hypothetical protein